MALTPEEIQTLVDFEQQIQWRWTSGDPTGYMDALAEDVTYFDPFTAYLVVGREAVREYFKRLTAGASGVSTRHAYRNETARPLSDDEVLLAFNFTTYRPDDNGEEKEFLTWNMSLIFRKADGQWLLTHGHLSLRDAWAHYSLGKSLGK